MKPESKPEKVRDHTWPFARCHAGSLPCSTHKFSSGSLGTLQGASLCPCQLVLGHLFPIETSSEEEIRKNEGSVKGSPFPCAFLESNRVSVLHYLMRTECNWELNDFFLLTLLYAPTYSQLEKTITAIFLLLRKTIKTSEKKNLSIESINTYNSVENTLKQIQSLTNQTAISFLYFVFPPSFPRIKAACIFFFFFFPPKMHLQQL